MFSADTVIAFVITAIVLVVVPGPTVLFTIGRSLALGRAGGFLSILGTAVGSLVLVAAIALGLGTLIAASSLLFTAIKVLGAAYLVVLGVRAILHRRAAHMATEGGAAHTTRMRVMVQGFVVGVSNPKSIAFFIAVLPQFVDTSSGSVPVQLVILGAIVVAIGLSCDALWVLISSAARSWFARSPRRIETMGAVGGGMMIALGLSLLVFSDEPATT